MRSRRDIDVSNLRNTARGRYRENGGTRRNPFFDVGCDRSPVNMQVRCIQVGFPEHDGDLEPRQVQRHLCTRSGKHVEVLRRPRVARTLERKI
jgi:hypothetical protein